MVKPRHEWTIVILGIETGVNSSDRGGQHISSPRRGAVILVPVEI